MLPQPIQELSLDLTTVEQEVETLTRATTPLARFLKVQQVS